MKKNIAVVCGGYTQEAKVSLKSGEFLLNNISVDFDAFLVIISKDNWFVKFQNNQIPIQKEDFSLILNNHKITFDLIINTIHGTPGENGLLQAYWKLLGLKYTGCDFFESALTFHKKNTLILASQIGIPIAKSILLKKNELPKDFAFELNFPVFVKPNASGSSLGVSKVMDKSNLETAIKHALMEDDEILIEESLDGTEVSCGIVQLDKEPEIMGITEIVSETEFFDYHAKYNGKSKEITPARISEKAKSLVEEFTIKLYKNFNLKDIVRIDYIIVNDIPHLLEINTNPGMSPASIFPQQVAAKGIKFSDLLQKIISNHLS